MRKTRLSMRVRAVGLCAIGLIAASAITGSAIALTGGSSTSATQASMADPERLDSPVRSLDPRLPERFAIFRSPKLQVEDSGAAASARPFAQNPELARAIPVDDGRTLYVIPGDDSVCLGDDINFGHTCVSVAEAETGSLLLLTLADPREPSTTVSGLAPDGVSTAVVELATGTTVDVPVHDNVYDASFRNGVVTAVSWTSSSGQRFEQRFPGGMRRPLPPA